MSPSRQTPATFSLMPSLSSTSVFRPLGGHYNTCSYASSRADRRPTCRRLLPPFRPSPLATVHLFYLGELGLAMLLQ
ncbi:hypothetical protein PVAP13_7KG091389 [Panicum virgatum]|uniref:Uncharacterized protein n=1 Tax=Panicum virgatum TaxID=38727 RepID=A0A8T0QCI1_PANVG|nr:hypothetical protein PVAP13_7KG091389 [Panicum virgatum]